VRLNIRAFLIRVKIVVGYCYKFPTPFFQRYVMSGNVLVVSAVIHFVTIPFIRVVNLVIQFRDMFVFDIGAYFLRKRTLEKAYICLVVSLKEMLFCLDNLQWLTHVN